MSHFSTHMSNEHYNTQVRKEAVLLVGMVAQDHQDAEPLLDAPGAMWAQKVRLPDACFMQVCGAFFDSDWHVREEACKVSALGCLAFLV